MVDRNHDRRLHISLRDDLEEQIGVAVAVGEVSEFVDHEQRGLDVAVQAAAERDGAVPSCRRAAAGRRGPGRAGE